MTRRKDERTPKQISQDRKLAQAADGRAAMLEIAERAAFVATNTARLRDLRLAKEAREAREATEARETAEAPKAVPRTKTRTLKA